MNLQRAKTATISAIEAGRVSVLNGATPGGLVTGSEWRVFSRILSVETQDAPDFVDITDKVAELVTESGITSGQVLIHSTHTTCSVIINESEPLLLTDMEHFLDRTAPKDMYYGHNDFAIRTVSVRPNECPNGHAHCQHMVLGTNETVPVIEGRAMLGEFQRIFVVELDEPKPRNIAVQVSGLA
jgi:secondary thiamine-phosphate synthase enzyme